MKKQIKSLAGEEINRFTTLIKNKQGSKLTANQLIQLQPHIYADYRNKMKQFARKRCFSQKKPHQQNDQDKYFKKQGPFQRETIQQVSKIDNTPSFYYSKETEIMSLKQFIFLLEEAKKKIQIQQRFKSRARQRQFVREVGREIQSSHSQRNLRLTSSSANRIKQRINQIKYSNFQV